MKGLLMLALMMVPLACLADIYVQTEQNGNLEYSDVPVGNNAQRVDLPPANTAPGPAAPQSVVSHTTASGTVAAGQQASYTVFDIASPANQETIQNQPVISIDLSIDPPLSPEDKIQIYLDGVPWGPPGKTTHFEFNAPERGTHTLSAKLLDSNNNVLKESGMNTIYIHQAHLGGAQ